MQDLCATCEKNPRYGRHRVCKDCRNAVRRQRWAEGKDRPKDPEARRKWDRERARKRMAKIRKEVLDHYGAECACCGEDHLEFLTLDHINGREPDERTLSGYRMYYKVKREGFPDKYRILCWNCNAAYGIYGRCPHMSSMKGE